MASRFSCSICLDNFDKPKIIDCHHTFCEKCLDDHIRVFANNNEFACPLCRRTIRVPENGVSGFTSNFYLEDYIVADCNSSQLKQEAAPICESCNEARSSKYRCDDCKQFLCEDCKANHESIPECGSHSISGIDKETISQKAKMKCSRHPDQCLEFFCRNCVLTACYKCSVTSHSGHLVVDIDYQLKKEACQELENMKSDFERLKKVQSEQLEFLKGEKKKLQNRAKQSQEDIAAQIEVFCQSIKRAGQKLMEEVAMKVSEGEHTMDELIVGAEKVGGQVESNLEKTNRLLENDEAVEMVSVLPNLCLQQQAFHRLEPVAPIAELSIFKPGNIDFESVAEQFGNVLVQKAGVFQSKFCLKEVLESKTGVVGPEIRLKNQIRCSLVSRIEFGFLSVLLRVDCNPKPGEFPHPIANDFVFVACLVNKNDSMTLKTKLNDGLRRDQSYHFFEWKGVIDWAVLSLPENGFVDDSGEVVVRVTTHLKEIPSV